MRKHLPRINNSLRQRHNWIQFLRFGIVGASGYLVNLTVFFLVFDVAGVDRKIANTAAFLVAVANNFTLNRLWTFSGHRGGQAGFQAARFLVVSFVAFLFGLGVLEFLVVVWNVPELAAQAVAAALPTPLNFIGNRLWVFRHRPKVQPVTPPPMVFSREPSTAEHAIHMAAQPEADAVPVVKP